MITFFPTVIDSTLHCRDLLVTTAEPGSHVVLLCGFALHYISTQPTINSADPYTGSTSSVQAAIFTALSLAALCHFEAIAWSIATRDPRTGITFNVLE